MDRAAGPPTAVLFDLDGTLIATRRLYLEAFADALEPTLGRRPSHDEMMGLHPRAERRFLEELGGRVGHQGVMDRFYGSYKRRHDRDFEGIYPGILEMLGRLRAIGVPVGLVTGKSRLSWKITSPLIGLGAFRVEVFDEDVSRQKPDPEGLELAVRKLGVAAEAVLYVGDTPTDLEAAVGAGVRPGAAMWSKREEERLPFRQLAEEMQGQVFDLPTRINELFGQH